LKVRKNGPLDVGIVDPWTDIGIEEECVVIGTVEPKPHEIDASDGRKGTRLFSQSRAGISEARPVDNSQVQKWLFFFRRCYFQNMRQFDGTLKHLRTHADFGCVI
jgi:hypothetical protein